MMVLRLISVGTFDSEMRFPQEGIGRVSRGAREMANAAVLAFHHNGAFDFNFRRRHADRPIPIW